MKKVFRSITKSAKLRSPNTIIAFLLLLVLPLITIFLVQQRQDIRQRAQVAPTPPPITINIVDFQFSPGTITVPAGTRITWINRSTNGVPHTTTSDISGTSNSWDSGILNPGSSFSRTFNTTGTFNYHCNVHGGAIMSGRIIVVPNIQPPTPTTIITGNITPLPTATPTPAVGPGTPTPIPNGGQPPYVCLGSCPTPTPTPKPPTPTNPYDPTPTPTSAYNPPPTPTSYIQPATPTPCPTGYTTAASDTSTSIADNRTGVAGIFDRIIEFILNLFFRLFQLFFGINLTPVPSPTPITPIPTQVVPTSPIVTALPYMSPTPTPAPYYPTPTLPYYVTPTIYYVTPTPTPYGYPSPTDASYPYATPTPTPVPCYPVDNYQPTPTPTPTPYITPIVTLTPSPVPSGVTPSVAPSIAPSEIPSVAPSRTLRSVDDFRYRGNGSEPLVTYNITAEVVGDRWLFNRTEPGPLLTAKQGDRVRVNMLNLLPESLVIHWHGIEIFASQDGVAGVTQDAVKPGQSFTYDYIVPDAGTYWYHTHQKTSQTLPKGLFGQLIVEPKVEQIKYDRSYAIIYRNKSLNPLQFEADPGEKVRVRLTNSRIGDFAGSPVTVAPVGAPYKVVAMDGQDINEPQDISNQLIEIGFAQRYDLSFTMPASGSVKLVDKENLQTLTFGEGEATQPDNLNTLPMFDWTAYGVPTKDTYIPRETFDIEQTLEIGPNLSINGKLGHDIPDFVTKEGQVALIKYVNNSNFSHPMHLHGTFYTVIKKNGKKVTGSPIHLDTILLHPGETADVAFYNDNPGVWMLHCHILDHAALGLAMLQRYDDVFTPYKMGGDSGNQPE